MGKLSARLESGRNALARSAEREAFESYVRRGAVPDVFAALSAAASDEQKFLALCAGLSGKALGNGRATTYYTWRAVGDDKVRGAHAALHGQDFAWSSPPPSGHPGTEHNCRCWAELYYGDSAVPDSLLHLTRNRQVVSDPDQRIVSVETLTRPDGSIAASLIEMVDGASISSVFHGASVSQLVSFSGGSNYQTLVRHDTGPYRSTKRRDALSGSTTTPLRARDSSAAGHAASSGPPPGRVDRASTGGGHHRSPASGMNAITRSTLLTALGRFGEAEALLGFWIPGQRRWLETDDGTIRKHYRKGSKFWKRSQDGHDKLAEQHANVKRLHELLVAGRPGPMLAFFMNGRPSASGRVA